MDGRDCSHSPINSGNPNAGTPAVTDPMPPYRSFKRTFRAMADPSPPIRTAAVAPVMAGFFSDEEPRHFLDSCFLCKKPLAINRDIFMYRGDTPFCSVERRREQIEIDEAEEKKAALKHQVAVKHKEKSPKIRARAAGTVVAG